MKFRVSWGSAHGADTRRVLAMVCRRGSVRGNEVGAITVERAYSIVEIAGPVADAFQKVAAEPDPRDPRVNVWRDTGSAAGPSPVPSARVSKPRLHDEPPPARVSKPRIHDGKFARGTGARSHTPAERPPPRGPKKPHRKGQDRSGSGGDAPPKRRPG